LAAQAFGALWVAILYDGRAIVPEKTPGWSALVGTVGYLIMNHICKHDPFHSSMS
jgi:hypothetical protein